MHAWPNKTEKNNPPFPGGLKPWRRVPLLGTRRFFIPA